MMGSVGLTCGARCFDRKNSPTRCAILTVKSDGKSPGVRGVEKGFMVIYLLIQGIETIYASIPGV